MGREQKTLQHLAGADASVFGLYIFCYIFNIVNYPQGLVHILVFLGKISHTDCLADFNRTAVRLYPSGNHFHQRRFSCPVWSDNPDSVIL